jgi:hypothetical protein
MVPDELARSRAGASATSSPAAPYFVEIAFASSVDAAIAKWRTLKERYPMLLGSNGAQVEKVHIGADQDTFLVLAGPIVSSKEAMELCAKLKSAGQPLCFTKRSGSQSSFPNFHDRFGIQP